MSINRRHLLASSVALSAINPALTKANPELLSPKELPIASFDNSRDTHPGAIGFNVEDRLAIINLCNSYASGYDAADLERWFLLFTHNPICTIHNMDAQPVRLEGAAFRAAFESLRHSETPLTVQPLHYNGNVTVKTQTANTATSEMYMIYIPFDVTAQDHNGIHAGALNATFTSRYRFNVVKIEDVWRIAEYAIYFDQRAA